MNMEYQKYISEAKNKISNLSKTQKTMSIFLLLSIVTVGIFFLNPKKKLLEMRNSQRRSDVVNILNAVYKYSADGGDISFVTNSPTMICKTGAQNCEGLVDISNVIAKEKTVLSEIPTDPNAKDVNSSGYQIWKSNSGRLNVAAPLAENKAVISLSK